MAKVEKVDFEARIAFRGQPSDLETLVKTLKALPVTLSVENGDGGGPPGYWGKGPDAHIPDEAMPRLVEGMQSVDVGASFPGGIKQPHIHEGRRVVFLSRERFSEAAAQVAARMATRIEKLGNPGDFIRRLTGR